MGLDIYLRESWDWEKSLRDREIIDTFVHDWKAWNPKWHEWHLDHSRACPTDDPENVEILRLKVLEFCRANSLRCTFWLRHDQRIYEPWDGVTSHDIAFRSSYHEMGCNHILRRNGIPDAYGIFDVGVDYPFDVIADWPKAREKALASLEMARGARLPRQEMETVERQLGNIVEMCDFALLNGPERFRAAWSA